MYVLHRFLPGREWLKHYKQQTKAQKKKHVWLTVHWTKIKKMTQLYSDEYQKTMLNVAKSSIQWQKRDILFSFSNYVFSVTPVCLYIKSKVKVKVEVSLTPLLIYLFGFFAGFFYALLYLSIIWIYVKKKNYVDLNKRDILFQILQVVFGSTNLTQH